MDLQRADNWWTQPCGARDVLALAVPLILSTGSWTLMHFADRVFLTAYSQQAIAAAMPAGLLNFSLVCLPLGIAGYVNTFVAQYYGAGQLQRVGRIVWQGIWLGLISVPILLLLIPVSPQIFAWAGHSPGVAAEEVRYFQTLAIGGGAAVIGAAQSSFFTGIGRTRIVLWIDLGAALLNILLDWAMIWGHLGLPAWGVAGAGIATSVSQWIKVGVYGVMIAQPEFRETYGVVQGLVWDRALLGRLLKYGGPSGLQMCIEVTAFTAFSFLMGRLGEQAMAASNIAFSINSMAFIPMIGLGIAVSTLVGHRIGARQIELATRATWTSVAIGIIYTGVMAILFVVIPDVLLIAHARGAGESFESLRPTCHYLLRFVAAYCVMDTMQIIFSSAIKGAGDSRFVLWVALLVSPLLVALAWGGIYHWHWGLWEFWAVVTGWIMVLAVIFLGRFLGGRWKQMHVIEPDFVHQSAAAELAG